MKTTLFTSTNRSHWGVLFAALLLAGYAFGLPLDAAALTLTRGPYLQLGTQSSIVVRWRTETATDSRVRYGTNPSNLSSVVDDSTSATEHTVKLTGLNPSTKYYYSVGRSTATLAGGASHFFVTAPTPGTEQPTHIWVVGNSGTANAKARAVRDAYLKYKDSQYTHLWLMLGDNAYQGGTESDYQGAVFNTYPTLLRQTVLWPTLGRRDAITADSASQSGAYYDIFTLPKQGEAGGLASGTEAHYSFDYGNIHFVVLDSVESSKAPAGAMLTWLKNDLAATTEPWIIAYWYHPPYSKGSHDSDTETALREMRENALPILEDAGVDLVLSGHSGSYERSFLIDGHYGSSGTFDPKTMLLDGGNRSIDGDGEYRKSVNNKPVRGTVYAVVGSSGETRLGSLDHPVMYVSLNALGSTVLDVNGPVLDAAFLDDTGQIRDRFRMVKTTDTTKASTSAPDVPTTEVNPTPQTVTVSPTGGTVGDAAGNTSLRSSNTGATTQGVPTTGTLNAEKVSTAPVIDGQLSESGWKLQTSIAKSVIGIRNNTTTFDVLWDNTYFYVGAKVLDSILKNDSPNVWNDDGVEIYIDPNHSHSTTYDATDLQLIKGYNDAALYAATSNNTSGVLHKWATVSGGYTVELAIPWSKLGVTPTANMTIGFDIGVNDDDNGSARDAQMTWNGTSNNYRNTSAFGHVVLMAASDTTPPSTPTGLTATAASSSQIDVSWNASTDNVGVTGYKVYRKGAQIATTTGTSYSNTGLPPSITYSYVVAAYDAAGNTSTQSTSVSATTQAAPDTTAPSAPTNLTANAVSSSQINLAWTSSTDNVGLTGYKIYRGGTQITTVSGTSYQNTGLAPSTTYTYKVAAYDAAGNTSAQASSASATTQGPLPSTSLSITSYGATGNDTTDDTTAINNTISAAKAQGKSVYVPAGNFYHKEFALDGVSMTGASNTTAILYAFDANNNTVFVRGSGVTVSTVQLKSASVARTSVDHNLWIDFASNFTIDSIIVDGGNSAGIFNRGGTNGKIINNTVRNTLADAIHNTRGATDIIVANNTVRNPGDDMIAVVSYLDQLPAIARNILIQDNDVSDNDWGRGITVVGGSDVTIQRNTVANTRHGAGIYVATELAHGGYPALSNILVINNHLSNNSGRDTGQGAMHISGKNANINRVRFQGNTISEPAHPAIKLEGDNTNTALINNTMTDSVNTSDIWIVAGKNVYCSGNTLNGNASVPKGNCTGVNNFTVTGSSLTYTRP